MTFARYADTVCPLVLSHDVLTEFLKKTQIVKLRSEDGTAIGDAIALAAARLKKAEEEIQRRNAQLGFGATAGRRTAVARLQDQEQDHHPADRRPNNMGQYESPRGGGTGQEVGHQDLHHRDRLGARPTRPCRRRSGPSACRREEELDEGLLKAIAEKTGGFYSRADDAESLRKIVKKIDELEKTEVKSVQYMQYAEHFGWLDAAGPGAAGPGNARGLHGFPERFHESGQ